jgi:hypothetical protein
MRHFVYAALVLGPVAALATVGGIFSAPAPVSAATPTAPTARACDSHCARGWMDANLRLNQLQFVGTDASYKQKPSSGALAIIRMGGRDGEQALDFGEAPLAA